MIFGISVGYQMMGETLSDPHGVEAGGTIKGMGLLPMDTVFAKKKTRTRVEGSFGQLTGAVAKLSDTALEGYEIHMGETILDEHASGLITLENDSDTLQQGHPDGSQKGNVYGCYVHGIFDEKLVSEGIVSAILKQKGYGTLQIEGKDWNSYKEEQYDQLADILRESLDMKAIYKMME